MTVVWCITLLNIVSVSFCTKYFSSFEYEHPSTRRESEILYRFSEYMLDTCLKVCSASSHKLCKFFSFINFMFFFTHSRFLNFIFFSLYFIENFPMFKFKYTKGVDGKICFVIFIIYVLVAHVINQV